jgi:tetratricopeptide (TPR) repeat protein
MMNRILLSTVLMAALGVAAAEAQPTIAPAAPPTRPARAVEPLWSVVVPEVPWSVLPAEAALPSIAAIAVWPDMAVEAVQPAIAAMKMANGRGWTSDERADDLYDRARNAIEEGRYDRALADLDRLLAMNSNRTDAALYWKAYSQGKLGQRTDALTTLADFQKRFADSRWLRDVKALDVELRQASGQKVSPESESDDELKLMALRGLMNSDPDQALPVIAKMLTGANSPKVKDRALFVLSQSHSPRAREIITGIAKGNGNPDLQLKAIRYLGIMGDADNRQVLADVYKSANDVSVKRAILRSYMQSGDRERLLALAKSETDASLRGDAVQQLGIIHATSELSQLYGTESAVEIKKRILQAMFISGESDKLIELAKGERDPELRKTAIHNLGLMKRPGTSEALTSIYASDSTPEVRKAVVNALFLQNNAAALVSLARNEKSPEMKKEIVSKLSIMKSKEATDYLLELLK